MKVSMWFIRQTDKARLYYKRSPYRSENRDVDQIWIPLSVIDHTTKHPQNPGEAYAQHDVTIADWFADKNNL